MRGFKKLWQSFLGRKVNVPQVNNRRPLSRKLLLEILEDRIVPSATVTIAETVNATESGTVGIFVVTQTGATGAVDVGYAVDASSTAVSGVDFQALSGSVTIPAGDTTAQIQVTPINQYIDGGSKTVVVDVESVTDSGSCGCCGGGGSGTIGSPSSATLTITDDDVNPVSLTNPGDQANFDGDTVNVSLTSNDADSNPLSFSATNLPSGLSIDPVTGAITGVIADTVGSYAVTVTATDSVASASATQSFNWTVNNPVSLTNPGDQTNYDSAAISLPASASDGPGNALTYSATSLPNGLSIDPDTGAITGVIADAASSYSVTVTATDSVTNDSASQTFNWTVNANPVGLTNPGNQTNFDADTVSLPLSASDSLNNSLSFTATGLPSGLGIDGATGTISGTIASSADINSPYSVTINATDSTADASASQTFNWTVNPAVPIVTNPGSVIGNTLDPFQLQIIATEQGDPTLSYSATGLPSGLAIDASTGLISGTFSGDIITGSPYSVTVTVSDGTNSAACTFTITINEAYLILGIPDQDNIAGTTVSVPLNSWYDDVHTPTFSASNLPPGLSIDGASGTISGTISYSAASNGPYYVTVTATTATGVSLDDTFNWNIETPEISIYTPGDQQNITGDSVNVPVQAADDDGTALTYIATGLPAGLSIDSNTGNIFGTIANGSGTTIPYSVTVTATDAAANVSSNVTFAWKVSDIILQNPGDQTNLDGSTVNISLSAISGGSGALVFSVTGLPPGLTVDSTTGIISGTITNDADVNSPYSVTAIVAGNFTSDTQTFSWYVQALSIATPGDQASAVGDSVNLAVITASNDPLFFIAVGLPDGLSIDSSTGAISGNISSTADVSNPYTVVITATDILTEASATTSFSWTIVAASGGTNIGLVQSLAAMVLNMAQPGPGMSGPPTGNAPISALLGIDFQSQPPPQRTTLNLGFGTFSFTDPAQISANTFMQRFSQNLPQAGPNPNAPGQLSASQAASAAYSTLNQIVAPNFSLTAGSQADRTAIQTLATGIAAFSYHTQFRHIFPNASVTVANQTVLEIGNFRIQNRTDIIHNSDGYSGRETIMFNLGGNFSVDISARTNPFQNLPQFRNLSSRQFLVTPQFNLTFRY